MLTKLYGRISSTVLDLADRGPRDRPGAGSGEQRSNDRDGKPKFGGGATVFLDAQPDRSMPRCALLRHRLSAATPLADVTAAIAAALAPYDRDAYTHGPFDPSATWDHWEPARTAAAFPLLPRGLDRLRPGRRRVAFAAPKAAIDFAAIRDHAVRHAAGEFDAWAELTAAHPGTRPLSDFGGQSDWLAQPAVQAAATAAATQRHQYFTFQFLLADPVATLVSGRDAYLARAAAHALATYVYITLTGNWLSEETGNRGADEHALALSSYLESVAPDTLLARVRCHA